MGLRLRPRPRPLCRRQSTDERTTRKTIAKVIKILDILFEADFTMKDGREEKRKLSLNAQTQLLLYKILLYVNRIESGTK